jgi:HlyD family secretion protein
MFSHLKRIFYANYCFTNRNAVANFPGNKRRGRRSCAGIYFPQASFLIKYGTVFFLCILVAIVIACWFIQYPDVITANAKLKSINAPKAVINKIQGKLVKLLSGKMIMLKRMISSVIWNVLPAGEVLKLGSALDTINAFMQQDEASTLSAYITSLEFKNLGELQQPYQTFIQAFIVYKDYINNGFYARKRSMLANDLNDLARLHANLGHQKYIQQQDETLA